MAKSGRFHIGSIVLAIGMTALLCGCGHRLPSVETRQASFHAYREHQVQQQSAQAWLKRRTYVLIIGAHLEDAEFESGVWNVTIMGSAEGMRQVAVAGALPVSEDGYFLTVAHAVDQRPLYVCSPTSDGYRAVPARVVWTGSSAPDRVPASYDPFESDKSPGPGEIDLAVIHVEASVAVDPWAASEELAEGTEVIGRGLAGPLAGAITATALVAGIGDGPPLLWARHDAHRCQGTAEAPSIRWMDGLPGSTSWDAGSLTCGDRGRSGTAGWSCVQTWTG